MDEVRDDELKERWTCIRLAEDGQEVWKLHAFADFYDFLEQVIFSRAEPLIWRGQRRDDWPLSSSLDRLLDRKQLLTSSADKLDAFARDHLSAFKYAARGRREGVGTALLENEWWALGQHYGLSTPLLDWTRSPFSAAYFAYADVGAEPTESVAVYCLSERAIAYANQRMAFGASVEEGRPSILEVVDPLLDDNPRLVSQGGLFTRVPIGMTVEGWVGREFLGDSVPVLRKILLPRQDRTRALRSLNRMNINPLSLFPDLAGASLHANLDLELELNVRGGTRESD